MPNTIEKTVTAEVAVELTDAEMLKCLKASDPLTIIRTLKGMMDSLTEEEIQAFKVFKIANDQLLLSVQAFEKKLVQESEGKSS